MFRVKSGVQTIYEYAEKFWERFLGRLRVVGGQHLIKKHVPDEVHLRLPGTRLRFGDVCIVVFLDLQILQ